jgi:bifunctional non-homologous end joining protein LigD
MSVSCIFDWLAPRWVEQPISLYIQQIGNEQERQYRAKRDFRRTPEPASGGSGQGQARFVVHEHHARRLHWDLRLEREGTLMSWAVPNGIPQDPSENRKAIHVEDHPLSYIDFEGDIPEGNYGAGRVLIWDRGSYDCEKLEDGKLVVVFHGKRLRGRYALFRTHGEKDWMIHRMDPPAQERETMPEHLLPMLANSGELPRKGEQWAFEVKWDGIRALTYWRPGRLRIESRNLNDVSSRYPELRALARPPPGAARGPPARRPRGHPRRGDRRLRQRRHPQLRASAEAYARHLG